MIPNNCNYKKVHIQITTYKKHSCKLETAQNMNPDTEIAKRFVGVDDSTKFICSICLNAKPKCNEIKKTVCNKRKSKSCPICQKGFEYRWDSLTENKAIPDKNEIQVKSIKMNTNCHASSTKTVQTSQPDVTQGLNLLNEVLTVFQSKKQICVEKEKYAKTVIVKDACVETEKLLGNKEIKPKLTVSKIFHLSIEESSITRDHKFTIVNCSQPRRSKDSLYLIDLIKHKSSSIPQMKLEELKHSLKEKTRSKDAIEEVNRMFATVRNNATTECLDDRNRPITRSGPRVLPVVKTKTYENDGGLNILISDNNREDKKGDEKQCKICQTKSPLDNFHMSSGDSLIKPDSCQHKMCDKTCGKCSHTTRCHNSRQVHDVCEHCCQRCTENRYHHGCYHDINDGDSCTSF